MGRYQAYPEYKDSGVEWLDSVPSHWTTAPIKYMALDKESLFLDGDWIESKDISGDEIRYITTGNVGEGVYKEQGVGFISTEKFIELNCTEVFPGDILMSRLNAPIGRSCIVPDLQSRIVTSVDNVIFRPDNGYAKEFLVYLFSCADYFAHTANLARGATMQRISRGLLGNVRVIVPTLAEQKAIANFLDHETAKIDTLIEKQQQLIQLLKEKRQAVISHAVTKGLNPNAPMKDSGVEWLGEVPEHWEGKSLNYLIAHTVDNRGRTPPVIEEGIPMCEVSQVAGNGMYTSNDFSKFISKESYDQFVRSDVKENDVLFVTVGATFGKTCLVPPAPDFFIAQNVVGFRCKHDVDPKYFMFLLSSDVFKEAISATNKSSTIDNVKVSDLVRTKLAVPPLIEQTEIANYIFAIVDKYEALIDQAMLVINLLQERRTALISAAVTGKIDVRGWQAPQN